MPPRTTVPNIVAAIDRQDYDEDDVGRAGYIPPVNDQDVCCTLCGSNYSPQLVREMLISGALCAAMSMATSYALHCLYLKDSYAIVVAITIFVGAAVMYHKSTTKHAMRRPAMGLIYRLGAALCVLAGIVGLAARFDRRSFEKQLANSNDAGNPYAQASNGAEMSSFSTTVAAILFTFVAAALFFVTMVLATNVYNTFWSKVAREEAASNAATTIGGVADDDDSTPKPIRELCAEQLNNVVLSAAVLGVVVGVSFGVSAVGTASTSSSTVPSAATTAAPSDPNTIAVSVVKQLLTVAAGFVVGVGLGNVNHYADLEEEPVRRQGVGPIGADFS